MAPAVTANSTKSGNNAAATRFMPVSFSKGGSAPVGPHPSPALN